ncbi:TonB-dependent receptor family protein [Helicobacter baculiformis]|uniref:TonB-dependent receptor family protein n=1 Tax=Helicobacter baculiformis TaxID=427351 RepID=A0ABV7ZIZ7_9HELI|nr:TonB-dependent receptor family protein [Helicobacter baculiformis]
MQALESSKKMETHRLQRIEATGTRADEEAPRSWRSKDVKSYIGSRTVISHKALTQQANQSIEEALQNVPGIHVRNATGIGAVPSFSVRGFGGSGYEGDSSTALVLVNGIPVYVAPYANIGMSIFPVTFQSVDHISVTKGGESVQYGPNAFGGVINIITKSIPYKWENQVAERMTFWGRSNGGFAGPATKGEPESKTLGNNILYNTYVRSGGMINKYIGVQAQANWLNGQGFRYDSPTNIQNYMLDLLYQINESNKITAYYQYYKFFLTDPGSLSAQDYEQDRFQNLRPNNNKSGKAMRWGAVYQTLFGDTSKVGGDFTLTYYGHNITRDFQVDSNYENVNNTNNAPYNSGYMWHHQYHTFSTTIPAYTNQNYQGFFIFDHPQRYIMNAIEPNLNLVVATKSVKQTFKVGLRYMNTNMWIRPLQSTCNWNATSKSCNGMAPYARTGFIAQYWQDMFNNYVAAYLSDKLEFFKGKFVITPGVRYTYLNYNALNHPWSYPNPSPSNPSSASAYNGFWAPATKRIYNEWSPALNVGYKPFEDWLLYFNYRRSFIPPQHHFLKLTDTNYNQTFNEIEVGSRYTYKDLLSFNANYFVTFAQDYWSGGYTLEPIKNARSQGVELELYYTPIRGLQFHLGYTYIDAVITSNERISMTSGPWYKGFIPPGESVNVKGNRLPYVSPNQFIFDAMYTYKNTTFGISSYFYSRAYSSILNRTKSATQCFAVPPPFVVFMSGIEYACNSVGLLPWYWVWNVQVSQVFWQSGRHKIVGSLQANNIFDMKYWFRGIFTSPTGREPGPGRSITVYLSYEF